MSGLSSVLRSRAHSVSSAYVSPLHSHASAHFTYNFKSAHFQYNTLRNLNSEIYIPKTPAPQPLKMSYQSHQQDQAPAQPPRRTPTELLQPQGQERVEQLEAMQSYEATARQTEDDANQAILVKEFPKIDSSLIAAIYLDSKSLSATREMLQELSSTES
ncbi:hypothetical protein BCR34DRAFT_231483 [Clohesyomyces aquaticus]|uniref:Uncharacterized protein n=1 Tax=Clohesyomyces aquaticus TaxID=1231657 RepID=A0A1Y1ZXA0_9PLEO|nr:hypothetical protein BCR34DRAFT_231483 [Clohesyomyces aquaticus]